MIEKLNNSVQHMYNCIYIHKYITKLYFYSMGMYDNGNETGNKMQKIGPSAWNVDVRMYVNTYARIHICVHVCIII